MLRILETGSLQLCLERKLVWGKIEWFSHFKEARNGDPMEIAQDMMVHAVNDEQSTKLRGLSPDVDVVG